MILQAIINIYQKNKLNTILFVGLTLRLLSAVFSTGYGMHDDHFITIEVAQSWIDGENMNGWLPDKDKGYVEPSGHSLTYPSLMCGLLYTCEKAGIYSPAIKMLLIRLLHAFWAILCVLWGYKIIRKLYDERSAEIAGWLLALFWMLPMLSVRNLVEVACIPPLFGCLWLIVKNEKGLKNLFYLSGLVAGIAFSIRFQTSFFILGLGLALWIKNGFKAALFFGLGTASTILLLQGLVDISVWGYPFAELRGYIDYNIHHSGDYPNGPWYNYTLLLAGVLIPPMSFLLLFGFIREWKKGLLIVLPVMAFFLFHSYFPNKQERFVIPIIPFVLMLGAVGWKNYYESSAFWLTKKWLHQSILYFAVGLNLILLLLLSFSSTKKNRVDAMLYLSKYRNISCLAIENSNHESSVTMPKFYLEKQWPEQYNILKNTDYTQLSDEINTGKKCKPGFVLFLEEEHLKDRLEKLEQVFPGLTYETTISPSFLDEVMHWLNPVNVNQVTVIYRTGEKK